MNRGVAITGMGIISAIGSDVATTYDSLIAERTGISRIQKIPTIHRHSIMVGEVPATDNELADLLDLPSDHNYPRTALLGALAAKEAVAHAGIDDILAWRTGLVSATTVGGMDKTEKYYYDYLRDGSHRRFIAAHHLGDSTEKIAKRLGMQGSLTTTISTACSSSANAIMYGARLIKAGILDRVVVGGADALSKFTINGFNTLMILSDTYNTPFDEYRKGLNLGEGAGYVVLESDEVVKAEGKLPIAYLSGYGNANDAFHQTASSEHGEGATKAMRKALDIAELAPSEIDYVNAHGTATVNNDLSEGRALIQVFGESRVPEFSSTKPFTGHTLAAAGAVEAVFSILALNHGLVYPNLNFDTPMKEFDLVPVNTISKKPLNHILSNSLGFGGNCSTLIFSKTST